jgi:hypothetical protein
MDGKLGPQTITAIEGYKRLRGLPKGTAIEDARQSAAMDAALKRLDEIKRLYEEGTEPKPPLRK